MTVNSLLYCLRVILVLISLRFSFQFKFRACDRKLNCFHTLEIPDNVKKEPESVTEDVASVKEGNLEAD